jgi:hypothetical protein
MLRAGDGTVGGGWFEHVVTFTTAADAELARTVPAPPAGGWTTYPRGGTPAPAVSFWGRLGFVANVSTVQEPYHGLRVSGRSLATREHVTRRRWVAVPLWAVALLALAPSALLLHAAWRCRRRQWRTAHGLCTSCGFDLRATPGRCPECGSGREGA